MISNVRNKEEAIRLRRLGHTYGEIRGKLRVSKSTLSYWLSDLELDPDAVERIIIQTKKGREKSRFLAAQRNIALRLVRDRENEEAAKDLFERYKENPEFAYGLALYHAEGTKKSNYFAFTNSDYVMVRFFVSWIKRFLPSSCRVKFRLYIHDIYKHENCESFWSNYLQVDSSDFEKTIYKPTRRIEKKNPEYKGCIRVSIYEIAMLRRVLAWQKMFFG